MSRLLRAVLAAASLVLPGHARARWREEALAVLLGVHGARRLRFAVDTVVKAPLLGRQLRRAMPRSAPGRAGRVVAGSALLAAPVLAVVALAGAPLLGERTAEFLFLVAPCGMAPLVALRSFRAAGRRGGGAGRWLLAALVTVFAGTGPVAAGALSVTLDAPAVALAGSVVPGAWLVATSVAGRNRGPAALALLGTVAGVALTALLAGAYLSGLGGTAARVAQPLTATALLGFVPAYLTWSVWSGLRLLRGRSRVPA